MVGGRRGGPEGCDPNASAEGKCAVVQRAESTKCAYGLLKRKYSTSKEFLLLVSSLILHIICKFLDKDFWVRRGSVRMRRDSVRVRSDSVGCFRAQFRVWWSSVVSALCCCKAALGSSPGREPHGGSSSWEYLCSKPHWIREGLMT
jgi:hypothetical protein